MGWFRAGMLLASSAWFKRDSGGEAEGDHTRRRVSRLEINPA